MDRSPWGIQSSRERHKRYASCETERCSLDSQDPSQMHSHSSKNSKKNSRDTPGISRAQQSNSPRNGEPTASYADSRHSSQLPIENICFSSAGMEMSSSQMMR